MTPWHKISHADNPRLRKREFNWFTTTANCSSVTAPPSGNWRSISEPSSRIPFSMVGFLFLLWTRPKSKVMLWLDSVASDCNGRNPGALSTHTNALDCGFGLREDMIIIRNLRSVGCCSLLMRDALVTIQLSHQTTMEEEVLYATTKRSADNL